VSDGGAQEGGAVSRATFGILRGLVSGPSRPSCARASARRPAAVDDVPAGRRARAEEAGTAGNPFDIWEYRVTGSSVLPQTEIEKVLYPHLGPHTKT
jgi:hypothetical protein